MKEKSSVMGGQVDKVPSKDNRAKDSSEKKIAANRDYITNNNYGLLEKIVKISTDPSWQIL